MIPTPQRAQGLRQACSQEASKPGACPLPLSAGARSPSSWGLSSHAGPVGELALNAVKTERAESRLTPVRGGEICVSSLSQQLTEVTAPPTPPQRQPQRGLDASTLTSDLGVAVSGCLGFQGDREGLSGEPVPRPHVGRAWCSEEAAQPQNTASQSPPARPGAERLSPGQTGHQRPPRPVLPGPLAVPPKPALLLPSETRPRLGAPRASPAPTAAQGQSPASGPLCRVPASADRWVRRPGSRGGAFPSPWGGRRASRSPWGGRRAAVQGPWLLRKARWGRRRALEGHSGDTAVTRCGGLAAARACCHTCAQHPADGSALGSGTDVAGPRQLPCPPPSGLPASVVLQARWGLPRGSSPPLNEMICSIIKSKPRNRNSYSHGDQKESQAETLQ